MTRRRHGTILRAHIVTSCRKFDRFGDWYFVRHPAAAMRLLRRDPAEADRFYYDFKDPGAGIEPR